MNARNAVTMIAGRLALAAGIVLLFPTHLNAGSSELAFINPGAPTDGTNATAIINSAIDAASAAGGGIVYLPKGTYTIQGNNTPAGGAVVLKSNVCLQGDGPGATILRLKDNMGADVTGLVRTPSGTSVSNLCLRNLTIDGNRPNNAGNAIIGFYAGVNPSLGINGIWVFNTTATLTTTTAHRLSAGQTVHIFNTAQSALTGDFIIRSVLSSTAVTITVPNGANSETAAPAHIWYYPTALADAYVYDFVVDKVEIMNCTDYGFDPHERMMRLVILNSSSHDNGKDGFVADYIEHGAYINDHAYNNDRHGFNLTTATNNFQLLNCVAQNNGAVYSGSGAVIQRGSSNLPFPTVIGITGGDYHHNARDGILVQMGTQVTIARTNAHENGWAGIHMLGGQYSTIVGNVVSDNSQARDGAKDEIFLQEYDDTLGAAGIKYGSVHNVVINNCIASGLTNRARYSIEESDDSSDYNAILFNASSGSYVTHGANSIVTSSQTGPGTPQCPAR